MFWFQMRKLFRSFAYLVVMRSRTNIILELRVQPHNYNIDLARFQFNFLFLFIIKNCTSIPFLKSSNFNAAIWDKGITFVEITALDWHIICIDNFVIIVSCQVGRVVQGARFKLWYSKECVGSNPTSDS